MRFTDAHTPSAVCTPDALRPAHRALLLAHAAEERRARRLRAAADRARPADPAGVAQTQGYATACIGKWHLGMDWTDAQAGRYRFAARLEKASRRGWHVDFAAPIAAGPTDCGFDSYFGISASLDMPPYTFIENDRVTVPTAEPHRKERTCS